MATASAPPVTDPFATIGTGTPVESLGKLLEVPPSIQSIVADVLAAGQARAFDLGSEDMLKDFVRFARLNPGTDFGTAALQTGPEV